MKRPFKKKFLLYLAILLLVPLCAIAFADDDDDDDDGIQQDLPVFETTAAEVQQTHDTVIAAADRILAEIAALDTAQATFENTVKAYDEAFDMINEAWNRTDLLKDVHPDQALRDKAFEIVDAYYLWTTNAGANGDVYRVIKAFADTMPTLAPDEQKLLDDTVLGFKRAGFTDQGVVDPAILSLKQEIKALQSQCELNVVEGNNDINLFTLQELEGLSQEQLDALEREGDAYVVRSGDRGTLRDVIMTFAVNEETRRRAKNAYSARAPQNGAHLEALVHKRLELANLLGYETWADYKTEVRMAGNQRTAFDFVDVISTKLKPKLESEVAALSAYITPGVNDLNNQIDSWDVYFFRRLYTSNEFNIDYDQLKQYFPYETALDGMFGMFEEVLGIKIEYVRNPVVWHPDVKLVRILDALGGDDDDEDDDPDDEEDADDDDEDEDDDDDAEVLGYLYLDMFPRLAEGKMGHFASYSAVSGKELASGRYRKPVNTLVCNFPVNPDGTPQPVLLLDLEYMLHEFGHAIHSILSRPRFSSQGAFDVPRDFVEVPSQLLEKWIMDKEGFKRLAAPHPDLTDEFITMTLQRLKEARLATRALWYSRQFGFNMMDMVIHSYTDAGQIPGPNDPENLVALTNRIMGEVYLPYPEESHLITSHMHILVWGYDAGLYSYAWADSIVEELADKFRASPMGFMDTSLGRLYRQEILEPGATRDVNESVEAFLGQPLDPERKAFLKSLGVQ